MRKTAYLVLASLMLFSCQSKSGKDSTGEGASASVDGAESAEGLAAIEFTETAFDFGTVEEGEKVSHSYQFTNTGETSLVISNAMASCGCTVPDWTREPIPPGGTGEIEAVFDSNGRVGKQSKTITVHANTDPATVQLSLTGEVKAKAE